MTRLDGQRRTYRRDNKHHRRRLHLEPLESRRVLATFIVTNLSDGPVMAAGDLPGSLRQAIFDANANPAADTIEFEAGVVGAISLTAGELAITDSVTVNGPGAADLTIDAQSNSRVLNIDDDNNAVYQDVSISGLTLTRGRASIMGGAILNYENLTISESVISANSVERGDGGGIFSQFGDLIIMDSTVSQNTASFGLCCLNSGGGIYSRDGDVTVTDSVISYNYNYRGGGITSEGDGNLTIIGSTISGNQAGTVRLNGSGHGGGIHFRRDPDDYDDLTIIDSTIAHNYAGGLGGGLQARWGAKTIVDSTISYNMGKGGGGVFSSGNLTVNGSTIYGNSAYSRNGGGFTLTRQFEDVVTITNSTISGNEAYDDGGGIWTQERGELTITNSTISFNYAGSQGGGIKAGGDLTITNSTISGNSASVGGGILATSGGLPVATVIQHSTITRNYAPPGQGSGVAIRGNSADCSDDARAEVLSSIISGNVNSDVDYVDLDCAANPFMNPFVSMGHNLIGNGNAVDGATFVNNDQTNVANPLLGPLSNNGGPTLTHAVLPASPALDAGDPAAKAGLNDTPQFDQRVAPFIRVLGGRIDIGAFEHRPITAVDGDFNDDGTYDCLDIDALVAEIAAATNGLAFDMTGDGMVDLADRDAWLAEAGGINRGPGKVYLLGDATLDGIVDGLDFIEWNDNKFTSIAEWCAGDFNADGAVDGQDFVLWNRNKFVSSDGTSQIVLPDPHKIDDTRHMNVNNDTIVDASSVSPRLVPLAAKRVDSVFATSRRGEDQQDERPRDDSFENLDDALSINSNLL